MKSYKGAEGYICKDEDGISYGFSFSEAVIENFTNKQLAQFFRAGLEVAAMSKQGNSEQNLAEIIKFLNEDLVERPVEVELQ